MKRSRLPLLLAVVVAALVFVWMSNEKSAPRRVADGASHVEVGGSSGDDVALASVPVPTASAVEASEAPLDTATRVAVTEVNVLAGRTFAELVVLREGLDGPLMREYDVLAIAVDGTARRVRSLDVVAPEQLANVALFVLELPGACPRFVDATVLADQLEARTVAAPLEVRVIPSARLVVNFALPLAGAAPIERFALHADSSTPLLRARRDPLKSATAEYEQFVPEGGAWRRLADTNATDDERAAALRTVVASEAYVEVAKVLAPNAYTFLLPWIARAEAPGTGLTFEHVPSIAQLAFVVECAAALEHDVAVASSFYRKRQEIGGCAATGMVLERGETRVVNVRHVVRGSVVGAFPVDAHEPLHMEVAIVDFSKSGGYVSNGTWLPAPENGGPFELPSLVPGHYRFAASWHDAAGGRNWFETEFDLAPGERRDLGTLSATSGSLELSATLAVDELSKAAGSTIDVGEFTCLVAIDSNDDRGRGEATHFVWIGDGETVSVRVPPKGHASVEVLAAVARDVATESAPDFARRTGLQSHDHGPFDAGSGALVVGRRVYQAALPREESLALEITLAALGHAALDTFVPSEFVRPGARTRVWFVRDNGEFVLPREVKEWRGDPSGGGFLSGTYPLPVGEWNAFVRLELPHTADDPRFGVALGRVIVESGAVRSLALELVRGATLDFAANDPRAVVEHFLGSRGLVPRSLPNWEYTPFAGVAVGERVLVGGLLPDTEYFSPEPALEPARASARTGPPGSTTVVE